MKIEINPSYFNRIYLKWWQHQQKHGEKYFNILYGGAGSGKSRFLSQKLIYELIQEKRTLLCLRENLSDCYDSMHKEFLQTLDEYGVLDQVKVYKQPLRIEFPNGSEILYRGTDDESKLKSIHGVSMVWLEEADSIPKDVYEQLQLRLRTPGIKIRYYISFNPVSADSWLKKEFFDDPPESCSVLHSTYLHNRFLPQEYIDKLLAMKERSPLKYEVYCLGKWGVTGAKVYENWSVKAFNIHDVLAANPRAHHRVGIDWGYSADPTAINEYVIDTVNKKIYVHDEVYKKGMLNSEIAKAIKAKGWQSIISIADNAEQKSIAELNTQYGLNRVRAAKKGKGSIASGISHIETYEIIVHPRCRKFKMELENYTYRKDRKTGAHINIPIDMWNHALDNCRYVMEEFQVRRYGRPISKAAFGL